METWPKHYLAESDPWARKVTGATQKAISDIDLIRQNAIAQNQSNAAQFAALAQQISDLAERKVYSSFVVFTATFAASTAVTGTGASVTLTSSVPRKFLALGYVQGSVTCNAGSTTRTARVQIEILRNGASTTSGNGWLERTVGGTGPADTVTATIEATRTFTVGPDDGAVAISLAYVGQVTGDAVGGLTNPQLIVIALDRV